MGDDSRKYGIELTIWDGGSGSCHRICVCGNYETALIVKLALEKIVPPRYRCERGNDDVVQQTYEVKIVPLFDGEEKEWLS